MNILHGLLYPASYLRRDTMLRLDQVFSKLTLLVPTEKDINPPYPASNCSMEIEAAAPAPLGDRLDWFTGLINNWKSWAEEMGLGEKIPASTLIRAAKGEEESLQEILNTLRGTKVPDELMDARIFLQLSLDLDRRNDELQADFDRMIIHEDKLKSILKDPMEPIDSQGSGKGPYPPTIESLLMTKDRLRAWVLLWQKHTDTGQWPIGEGIAVKDLVDKAYEVLQPKEAPADLLDLVLPLDPNIKPGKSDKINNGLTSLIKTISNTSIHNWSENGDIHKLSEKIQQTWDKDSKNQIPGPTLNLTLYPKKTWNEVFLKAAGIKLDHGAPNSTALPGWSFFLC
jgi:hypothetical protein